MADWPPGQLLADPILMQRKAPSTVTVEARRNMNLTTNGRSLPTSRALTFKNEIVKGSHEFDSG